MVKVGTTSMTSNHSSSVGEKIVRASFVVAIAHFVFKLLGVVQTIFAARHLDGKVYDTVYGFAFEGCILTLFLIGEESIGPSFLPVFMKEKDANGEKAAWQFGNVILTIQLMILLSVVTLTMLFPDAVIRFITAWNQTRTPEKYGIARHALFWLAPSLIGLSLASTTYMLLNGYRRFFLAAFGDASWRICVLAALFVGMGVMGMDYMAIVFGLVVGSIAKLATHLFGLLRKFRLFRLSLRINNPAVRRMMALILPLLIGIIFAKVRDVVNNVYVLSTLDTDGLIKANSVGKKLHQTVGWMIPYAISIAMFPFFCELVDKNDKITFSKVISRSSRMLLSVFIPLALVCVVVSNPLCFLMQGGRFTVQEAGWTEISMACYVLVLPAFALEFFLMQAFFANRRMVSVTVVGVVFSALSIAISFLGIIVFGATDAAALAVIALGFTISRMLKSITLVFLLKKDLDFFPIVETLIFIGKALIVGLAAAGGCYLFIQACDMKLAEPMAKTALLLKLAGSGIIASLLFLVLTKILKLNEPFEMFNWALSKLRRRRGAQDAR